MRKELRNVFPPGADTEIYGDSEVLSTARSRQAFKTVRGHASSYAHEHKTKSPTLSDAFSWEAKKAHVGLRAGLVCMA